MSRYTKDEQTEIVHLAMELEAAITSENKELESLSLMSFESEPIAPQEKKQKPLKKVTPQYPETPELEYSMDDFLDDSGKNASSAVKFVRFAKRVKHPVLSFCGIGLCMMIIGFIIGDAGTSLVTIGGLMIFPGWIIVAVIKESKEKEAQKEYKKVCEIKQAEVEQAPDYLAARAEAERVADEENRKREEEYQRQEEDYRREYDQSMDQYKNVTLVIYRRELEKWLELQSEKVKILTASLSENRKTQETLYFETQIIPKSIRSLEDITFLYDDMSSSEHDIERAIDMLNAYKQRKVTREEAEKTRQRMDVRMDELRGDMQQGFTQVYGLIDERTYRIENLTAQLSSQMDDIRREIRRGNIAAITQRYITSRRIQSIEKKLH